MKAIRWNNEKNEWLKANRKVSFEAVLLAVSNDGFIDDIQHPNEILYPNQRLLIVKIKDYVYAVPYVENEEEKFLKTIIPSRKLQKKYSEL